MKNIVAVVALVGLRACLVEASDVRITEIMYQPSRGNVEYVELKNMGTTAANLSGIHFDEGKPFAALVLGSLVLQPGQTAVITNDATGLAGYNFTDYIPPSPIDNTVQWSSGELNDTGEEIVMRAADNSIIHAFTYSNAAPWPQSAAGGGKSLKIINAYGDYNNPANWFAELPNPGERAPYFNDTDNDGISDREEMLFGSDPENPDSKPDVSFSWTVDGQAKLTFPVGYGRRYRVEYAETLPQWLPLAFPSTGTGSFEFVDPSSPPASHRIYRIIAF
jgi:hypothetical protein